ncbi:hypothetical protein GQ457_11G023710 [Hibiscus cannabinus]
MRMQNQEAALKSLGNQVGKISQTLNTRPLGGFSSNTEVAKGANNEWCKAITPKSGKILSEINKNRQGDETVDKTNASPIQDKLAPADTLPAAEGEDQDIPSEVEEATSKAAATPHIKLPIDRHVAASQECISWTIADIKDISPAICMHKILLEEKHNPTVDAQRRLKKAKKDVERKELLKCLDAGIIYPISDSEWISLVQCVPKKGGMIVITNEKNKLIPTRIVTGRRMSFDLSNAPTTFQRCMIAIFSDMNEDFLEIFMDDFSTFDEGNVLGHKISYRGIEVDKEKIDVIGKLAPLTTVKGIRNLLGHADFYRHFIENFLKLLNLFVLSLNRENHLTSTTQLLKHSRLLVVDYVPKWVEAIATPNNDSKIVQRFLKKNIFTRFGVPQAIISNKGKHFNNRCIFAALKKLGVTHKLATA